MVGSQGVVVVAWQGEARPLQHSGWPSSGPHMTP